MNQFELDENPAPIEKYKGSRYLHGPLDGAPCRDNIPTFRVVRMENGNVHLYVKVASGDYSLFCQSVSIETERDVEIREELMQE